MAVVLHHSAAWCQVATCHRITPPCPARPTAASPQVPLLAPLTSQQRLALCTAFTAVSIRAGEGVIKKGEDGDTFYIIEEGACVVVADDGKVRGGMHLLLLCATHCVAWHAWVTD